MRSSPEGCGRRGRRESATRSDLTAAASNQPRSQFHTLNQFSYSLVAHSLAAAEPEQRQAGAKVVLADAARAAVPLDPGHPRHALAVILDPRLAQGLRRVGGVQGVVVLEDRS